MLLVPVVFGQEAPPLVSATPTDAWPGVVALAAVNAEGNGGNFCSGVLVAPGWVLTAAHCVTHMEALRRSLTPELVVVFGYDTGLPDGVTRVVGTTGAFVHADYAAGAFLHDLGLVRLAEEVEDVPTLPLGADAPTHCAVGDALRLVGWGAPGDDDLDLSVKRTAEVPLFDHDATMLYVYDTDAEQNACVGDSGGAVLRQRADGSVALAGLIAYVSDDDDTPCAGGYTAATRLDVHLDWVEAWTGSLPRPAAEGWPEAACLGGAAGGAGCASREGGAEGWASFLALLALATLRRARRASLSRRDARVP